MNNKIKGKTIIFLGSSVTYGSAANGVSFADFIGERNKCNIVKEAVSGTTLVDDSDDSYISRMRKMTVTSADLFVCQLSTNDAWHKKPLGKVSESTNLEDFDTKTVAGAIEYIICFARENYKCPVCFYTNPKYDNDEYAAMVALLLEIKKKWEIGIINLWDNEDFSNISQEYKERYMADPIHPTREGYLEWWTPYIEERIGEIIQDKKNKNLNKSCALLYYLASCCFYIVAIMNMVGKDMTNSVIYFCLGSTFLCLGGVYAKKHRDEDGNQ